MMTGSGIGPGWVNADLTPFMLCYMACMWSYVKLGFSYSWHMGSSPQFAVESALILFLETLVA